MHILCPTAPAEGALAEIIPGEHFNFDTVQNWYQSCRRIHGGLCEILMTGPIDNIQEHVSQQPPELQALEMCVVDVQKMCIKFAPTKCRNVAMSYVWVTSEFVRLTKGNFQSLTSQGALSQLQLPRTISEAIEITKVLNERYCGLTHFALFRTIKHQKPSKLSRWTRYYYRSRSH